MNRFKSLNTEKGIDKQEVVIKKLRNSTSGNMNTVSTSLGIVEFTPTFNFEDIVKIKTKYLKYSKEYAAFKGNTFKVEECKISDLGDMIIEVVYLNDTSIVNPCLVEHFELVK